MDYDIAFGLFAFLQLLHTAKIFLLKQKCQNEFKQFTAFISTLFNDDRLPGNPSLEYLEDFLDRFKTHQVELMSLLFLRKSLTLSALITIFIGIDIILVGIGLFFEHYYCFLIFIFPIFNYYKKYDVMFGTQSDAQNIERLALKEGMIPSLNSNYFYTRETTGFYLIAIEYLNIYAEYRRLHPYVDLL